jgi:hypothetical protein
MPIESRIVSKHTDGDSIMVVEIHTIDGFELQRIVSRAPGEDHLALMLADATSVEAGYIAAVSIKERDAAVDAILGGADPVATAYATHRYTSTAAVVRELLCRVSCDPDPGKMLKCRTLIDYGLATYADADLCSLLSLDPAGLAALKARYQAALAIADALPAAAQVVEL